MMIGQFVEEEKRARGSECAGASLVERVHAWGVACGPERRAGYLPRRHTHLGRQLLAKI